MLPFHDEPMIRENIIAKILFASCSAKISYHEIFPVYGIFFTSAKTYAYSHMKWYQNSLKYCNMAIYCNTIKHNTQYNIDLHCFTPRTFNKLVCM